ncbi:unnamed protein product, partial [Polarella glacialis]
ECDQRMTVPDPLAFNTGHSNKFLADGRCLLDDDLLAVAGMLQERPPLEEVNLDGNVMLTDRALGPFLAELLKDESSLSLRKVKLSQCKGAGPRTLEHTIQLIQKVQSALTHLDISGVHIATRLQLQLCQSLGQNDSIKEVRLAGTGFGGTCITNQCTTSLLSSARLELLDLSWNLFCKEEFQCLGTCLAQNNVLKHLLVDNCAAYIATQDTPVSELVERLVRNSGLVSLSLSNNRIDFRAAVVVEDALHHHPHMVRLYLAENPMGHLGVRSILRLISRVESKITHLDLEGCYSGASQDTNLEKVGYQVFSFTNPGGKYVLNLSRPYHRSLLKMLYKTAERFKLSADKAFTIESFTPPPFVHATKDAAGIWQVPTSGVLKVLFNVEAAMDAGVKGLADDDFSGFLYNHFQLTRFTPHFIKVAALFSTWKSMDGMAVEQEVFLRALASDFNMTVPYLDYM